MAHPPRRRQRGDHEPRLPRLLPPVLQPARPAAAYRSRARPSPSAARLPATAQRRADRQLRPRPAHPTVQRPRVRRPQPHLRLARPHRHGPPGRAAPPRRPGARGLRALRLPERDPVPGTRPLPRSRAPSGVRGVLAQLLRRPARTVRRGTPADVPHLLPRLLRGTALRRAERALPPGPVGAARRLPGASRGGRAHRHARARRPPVRRRGSGGAGRRHRGPPRGGGARPRPRGPARRRRGVARSGHPRLARGHRRPAHRPALHRLPALARPAGPCRPRRVPRHQRLRRPRQHQRPGTLRGRSRAVGRPHRRLGRGTARLRRRRGARGGAEPADRQPAPGLPGDPDGADRGRPSRTARRLPALPGRHPLPAAHRPHSRPPGGPGR